MIDFPVGDSNAPGYLAIPESNSGPGVLVLHAWWGLNDFFKALCDRLASQGFVAFAPDLYGGGTVATTVEEAEARMKSMDNQQAEAIALGAVDFLHTHPAVTSQAIGAIGFSMGSSWAVALASVRPQAIAAVVMFYGAAEADYTTARAAYLGHFAENDEWEDIQYVRQMEAEMRSAGHDVTLYTYPGAGHWFMEDNRPDVYDATSAELAWERTLTFLRSQLNLPRQK
jgi:carboxymethylenebutenolidase